MSFLPKDKIGFGVVVASGTLVAYYLWFGRSNLNRRRKLEQQLDQAQKIVKDLEDQLLCVDRDEKDNAKEIRVWMDGAFDMMHFGHMNAFRQGKALGTYLIVGVNSDDSITTCKGKPVNSDEERLATVRACRWVDEVVTNVPYIMTDEYLLFIIQKYRLDYIVHGDDPCIVNGKDVYESAVKLGKYLTIPRTEGISTTDIVGRMLLMTRSHHEAAAAPAVPADAAAGNGQQLIAASTVSAGALINRRSNFLTTSRTIRLFSAAVQTPKAGARVVYLAGSWDMFHAGHAAILEKAREFGDYVIVGVHSDSVVNQVMGFNLPILTMQERVLSVLGCKWVDDVLLDAPYVMTHDMISSLHIKAVVRGAVSPTREENALAGRPDPFVVPAELGILHTVDVVCPITVHDIIQRIQQQQDVFTKKFAAKHAQELEYYSKRYSNPL